MRNAQACLHLPVACRRTNPAILLTVLSVNTLGDALRYALSCTAATDPRTSPRHDPRPSRLAVIGMCAASSLAAGPPRSRWRTSITEVHAAMQRGALTCRQLVAAYLRRIDAYDANGPAINALIVVHPMALAVADSLDRRFAREGRVGPLHCIPMIVKDNFETHDLPATAGSSRSGLHPLATQLRTQREAGAGQEQHGRVRLPP
jgi:hypothetical protein